MQIYDLICKFTTYAYFLVVCGVLCPKTVGATSGERFTVPKREDAIWPGFKKPTYWPISVVSSLLHAAAGAGPVFSCQAWQTTFVCKLARVELTGCVGRPEAAVTTPGLVL